jgi:hypothetical protein
LKPVQVPQKSTMTARATPHLLLSRRLDRHRRLTLVIGVLLIGLLALLVVRAGAIWSATDDRLVVQIGGQASTLVDLRQSSPISPYLFGTNVFPETSTRSVDGYGTGFMSYGAPVTNGLRNARVNLLRFPGGNWGEEHLLSYDQLNSYSALLEKTGSQGMIQVRLSGSMNNSVADLQSQANRADLAGRWVDYMNNPKSSLRLGEYAHAPFHPVRFWTIGNEPDLLVNPASGKRFTVAEYVDHLVQFSLAMHQRNSTMQVFGPELSQFYGRGSGPRDSDGQLWMEGVLKGVGAYEKAHPELGFHLLDGVSFHFYPATDPHSAATTLMTNAQEWNYLLAPLRQLVRESLGRDAPLAVTEINSNASKQSPPHGLAALWWADTLGTLMNLEMQYVAFFSAEGVDSPLPLFASNDLRPTSMLRVLEVFSHLQNRLIPVVSQRDPISIYATQDDSHKAVSLLFVNKSAITQLAQVRSQNGAFAIGAWPAVDAALPPYSIMQVTLRRGGRADAYSFKAPATEDTNVAPLTHAACGIETGALAHDRPC